MSFFLKARVKYFGMSKRTHNVEKTGNAYHDANTKKIDDIIRNIQRD